MNEICNDPLCHRPLQRLHWGKNQGEYLICNHALCAKYHTPQGIIPRRYTQGEEDATLAKLLQDKKNRMIGHQPHSLSKKENK